MVVRIIISIIALVLGFEHTSLAQTQLVVPGKSAGAIYLGMTRAEVCRRLGKPTQNWTLKQNAELYSEDVWCRKQQGYSDFFTVITNCQGVVQIEVSNPRFKTVKGFSTLDEFSKFRSLYPHMQIDQHLFDASPYDVRLLGYGSLLGEGYYIDNVRQGFAVTLRSQCDKVDYELPSLSPDSIVVHKAGIPVLPIVAGKWASIEPRYRDDYLDQMRAWFAGGVYHPRSPQQILTMQKKAGAVRSK